MNDRMKDFLDGKVTTTSGRTPENFQPGAPEGIDPTTGQHKSYWVLSERERAKGFVKPVRQTYKHVGADGRRGCQMKTTMGLALAETYARDPKFYGATMCVTCGKHPLLDEFVWCDEKGQPTTERLG